VDTVLGLAIILAGMQVLSVFSMTRWMLEVIYRATIQVLTLCTLVGMFFFTIALGVHLYSEMTLYESVFAHFNQHVNALAHNSWVLLLYSILGLCVYYFLIWPLLMSLVIGGMYETIKQEGYAEEMTEFSYHDIYLWAFDRKPWQTLHKEKREKTDDVID
jgi:hypothetical protein